MGKKALYPKPHLEQQAMKIFALEGSLWNKTHWRTYRENKIKASYDKGTGRGGQNVKLVAETNPGPAEMSG